jgi:hypothetical protein
VQGRVRVHGYVRVRAQVRPEQPTGSATQEARPRPSRWARACEIPPAQSWRHHKSDGTCTTMEQGQDDELGKAHCESARVSVCGGLITKAGS